VIHDRYLIGQKESLGYIMRYEKNGRTLCLD